MLSHKVLIQTLLLVFVFGCAQTKIKQSSQPAVHLTKAQIEELNQNAMEKVSKRLEELSIAAKASGPDKVRFLASDMYLKG